MYSEHPTLSLLRRLISPVVVVLVLVFLVKALGERMDGYYLVLSIIVFFLSSHLFDDQALLRPCGSRHIWSGFGSVLFAWGMTVLGVVFLGYVTQLDYHYDDEVMLYWFVATPIVLLLVHMGMRWYIRDMVDQGRTRRAVIIGGNEAGERLASRMRDNECLLTEFLGFVDDRQPERLSPVVRGQFLGKASDILEIVRNTRAEVVYISLPISQKARINALLDLLKDSTASVYMVPDIFTYDLIQARIDQMGGVPIIAILETPFTSINAINKRLADVVLSILILALLSPLMILVAMLVKLSSPGPAIFKQRRYGLNGEEIIVYKFRSMRVTEDGAVIRQATKDDDRVTPIGRILRKTSLDELPQFINVLQGQMSIVGPRPHAVAHNELYRKLISGYMLRHKAKPGITGWAQVNGLRGETDTVDKMAARIQYDLNYLRNWSLALDLMIILKTVMLVFKDARAY
jgi:putative colanic acid biosynthesis UDP-glucose lipid carrier transferase